MQKQINLNKADHIVGDETDMKPPIKSGLINVGPDGNIFEGSH